MNTQPSQATAPIANPIANTAIDDDTDGFDWFEEIPANDAQWLSFSDFWWHEIIDHCGLDTSFVGAYADQDAISYAKSWHAQRCLNMGYPFIARSTYSIEVRSIVGGKPQARRVQGWIVHRRPGSQSEAMRRAEAVTERRRVIDDRDFT